MRHNSDLKESMRNKLKIYFECRVSGIVDVIRVRCEKKKGVKDSFKVFSFTLWMVNKLR